MEITMAQCVVTKNKNLKKICWLITVISKVKIKQIGATLTRRVAPHFI